MRCIVIPLHMTAISWDFAMEEKVIDIQSWYFLYETHFICISRRKIIKKEWNDRLFFFKNLILSPISRSKWCYIATQIICNQSNKRTTTTTKRGQMHSTFLLSSFLWHHGHFWTKTGKLHEPKMWSGMQILNSKKTVPFFQTVCSGI